MNAAWLRMVSSITFAPRFPVMAVGFNAAGSGSLAGEVGVVFPMGG